MPDEEPEGSYFESDGARAYRWRVREFERLGFSEPQAVQLAELEVDHHRVQHWLEDGCTIRQAMLIAV